jgi:hypothetical protein
LIPLAADPEKQGFNRVNLLELPVKKGFEKVLILWPPRDFLVPSEAFVF